MKVIPNNVLSIARNYIGYSTKDPIYKEIVYAFNSQEKLSKKAKLKRVDNWSTVFISVCFAQAGDISLIGSAEKEANKLITKFKRKKAWFECGRILPKVGDLVVFDTDYVGIVEEIRGRVITVIFGNKNDTIGRVRMLNNNARIVGYARPSYTDEKQAIDETAAEVLIGKWGNGKTLKKRLTDAGYDYEKVQRRVCELS